MTALTQVERARLRARHVKNTDLTPGAYCTNPHHPKGDHRNWEDWPCPVIRLLDELEALEAEMSDVAKIRSRLDENVKATRGGQPTSLFEAIRVAQDITARAWPHPGEPGSEGYITGQAELICALYGLNPAVWTTEVEAEIRQEHGKWVRT